MTTLFVPLRSRKGIVTVVRVSPQDAHFFEKYNYFAKRGSNGKGEPYIARTINWKLPCGKPKAKTWFLQWDILQVEKPSRKKVIDHKNGNTLDNTRPNLQKISHSANIKKQIRKAPAKYISEIRRSGNLYYRIFVRCKYIGIAKTYEKAQEKLSKYLVSPEYQGILLKRQEALAPQKEAQ
jgi:hypothetical protein